MFTIFASPKPFNDKFRTIQLNAIQSWLNLKPEPTIILFGDEYGTKQVVKKYHLQINPVVIRNNFGTPLVKNMFRLAGNKSQTEYLCFTNADIIFDPSITKVFDLVSKYFNKFMIISRRWNCKLDYQINFKEKNWFKLIKQKAIIKGILYSTGGIDLFIYPKHFFDDIPDFAIGRAVMDNWMVYFAKFNRIPIIDVTPALTLVHQEHVIQINKSDGTSSHTGKESRKNLKIAGGYAHCYTTKDADFVMDTGLNLSQIKIMPYHYIRSITRLIHSKIDKYLYY